MKIKTKNIPQVTDNLIRENIRKILEAKGITTTELASRLGVALSQLSVYLKENGTNLNQFTWRIINALDVPAEMLLKGPNYDLITEELIKVVGELPVSDRIEVFEWAKDKLELLHYRRQKEYEYPGDGKTTGTLVENSTTTTQKTTKEAHGAS